MNSLAWEKEKILTYKGHFLMSSYHNPNHNTKSTVHRRHVTLALVRFLYTRSEKAGPLRSGAHMMMHLPSSFSVTLGTWDFFWAGWTLAAGFFAWFSST